MTGGKGALWAAVAAAWVLGVFALYVMQFAPLIHAVAGRIAP